MILLVHHKSLSERFNISVDVISSLAGTCTSVHCPDGWETMYTVRV